MKLLVDLQRTFLSIDKKCMLWKWLSIACPCYVFELHLLFFQSIPGDMEFDPESTPPCYKTKDEVSVVYADSVSPVISQPIVCRFNEPGASNSR